MEDEKVKISLTTMIFIMLFVCIIIVGFIYLLFALKNNGGEVNKGNNTTVNTTVENNVNTINNSVNANEILI